MRKPAAYGCPPPPKKPAILSATGIEVRILQGHYQSERNFTFTDLAGAKNRRLKWKNQIARLLQEQPEIATQKTPQELQDFLSNLLNSETISKTDLTKQVYESTSNNLNSAEAFSIIDQNAPTLAEWAFIENLFGLKLFSEQILPSVEVLQLIESRQAARKAKNYQLSDELRDKIAEHGFTVSDGATPIWQYLN